ncbi:phospholipid carrier-dependent glycosyltransferase [Halorubellus sp. JP-L1]|uniref:glycosyltransferase family 39 protein n=1 Tax=Halorubellus sp. JP-L1 TaxID=2715753 RepID=UPI001407FE77|nr:glycosyltransferase family 39 protein [Halorubellus sp. JP-L1]NHN40960.1 phospholipid carrier-dependent glycosyltransferase [Halorubellus sp. JP-L1]
MNNETAKSAIYCFGLALTARIISVILTTATAFNPESAGDAVEFGNYAEMIAFGLRNGNPYSNTPSSVDPTQFLIPLTSVNIYELWGTLLAPFWLLPGPSGFYARLGNALLGALAIYNVYVIARYYHSHQAGFLAALPMIFYPSFVAVHSTLLREAVILFAITTTAQLLIIPSNRRSRLLTYAMAGGLLHVALLLRSDNVFIYASAIGAGLAVYAFESEYISKQSLGVGVILSSAVFIVALPFVRDGVEFLARTRELRAKGRAVYLPEIVPQTVLELGVFSWIGGAYFLYAPFPWMIETIPDLLVGFEGLISICYTLFAVWGIRSLGRKNWPATIALLVGLGVALVLYGVGTANYGTGMRHRQMFLWVVFLFGGIGFSERVRIVWPFSYSSHRSSKTREPST